MADQLTTVAAVKVRLGITDAADDALIGNYIDQVTEFIQQETGRRLIAETLATLVIDTSAGSEIPIPRGVRAVGSLAIATSDQPDDGSGTYAAVAAADVLLRPDLLHRRPGWPPDRILIRGTTPRLSWALNGAKLTNVDVDFATIPTRIAAVALDAVCAAYPERQSGASNVVGADDAVIVPWRDYFGENTAQWNTLRAFAITGPAGVGMA